MDLVSVLDIKIKEVCPIEGVSIGSPDDKTTWKIHFDRSATDSQKQLANSLLRDFVFNDVVKEQVRKQVRNADKRGDLSLKALYLLAKEKNANLTFSDYLDQIENANI